MRIRPLTHQRYLALHNRVDSRYICRLHTLRHSLNQSGHGGRRQTSLFGRLGDLGRVGRRDFAVYDGVEDGGTECAADRGREKGVEGHELDEGDEEGEDVSYAERMSGV